MRAVDDVIDETRGLPFGPLARIIANILNTVRQARPSFARCPHSL